MSLKKQLERYSRLNDEVDAISGGMEAVNQHLSSVESQLAGRSFRAGNPWIGCAQGQLGFIRFHGESRLVYRDEDGHTQPLTKVSRLVRLKAAARLPALIEHVNDQCSEFLSSLHRFAGSLEQGEVE